MRTLKNHLLTAVRLFTETPTGMQQIFQVILQVCGNSHDFNIEVCKSKLLFLTLSTKNTFRHVVTCCIPHHMSPGPVTCCVHTVNRVSRISSLYKSVNSPNTAGSFFWLASSDHVIKTQYSDWIAPRLITVSIQTSLDSLSLSPLSSCIHVKLLLSIHWMRVGHVGFHDNATWPP